MSKISKDYRNLSYHEKQKITQGSIIPRPIAWLLTKNENGSLNLAPFSYFAVFSPTLLAVSFTKMETRYKDTYVNLIREQEGVVHLANVSQLKDVDDTSQELLYNESELDSLNYTLLDGERVSTPHLKEALVSFEVKVEKEIQFLDDSEARHDNDVVFLRILNAHLDSDVYDEEKGYINADVLRPISRLGGPNYATILPIDFKRKYR